jgi:putative membrane protein PagO
MNSERVRILIGFVIISLIWGSTWMFIKVGLQSISPIFGVLLRFLMALGVLYIIVKLKRINFPWDKTAVFLYFTLGVISFGIPYVLVYWGEQHIGSGLASVLFGAHPFVVAVGSHSER